MNPQTRLNRDTISRVMRYLSRISGALVYREYAPGLVYREYAPALVYKEYVQAVEYKENVVCSTQSSSTVVRLVSRHPLGASKTVDLSGLSTKAIQ